jgi:hypothetical protein
MKTMKPSDVYREAVDLVCRHHFLNMSGAPDSDINAIMDRLGDLCDEATKQEIKAINAFGHACNRAEDELGIEREGEKLFSQDDITKAEENQGRYYQIMHLLVAVTKVEHAEGCVKDWNIGYCQKCGLERDINEMIAEFEKHEKLDRDAAKAK